MPTGSVLLPSHGLGLLRAHGYCLSPLSFSGGLREAGGLRRGREGKCLDLLPHSTRGICFSGLGWKGPEASCRGRAHTSFSAWHGALAWGCDSIIWITQERAIGVIPRTQLPNKVEKNAESLILKIEGRKSAYMFNGPLLWSLIKRRAVRLVCLHSWSLEYHF